MAVKIFAAIVVGSAETEMRIYELKSGKGMREIDRVSMPINLGADAYDDRKLEQEKIAMLCTVLRNFRGIMESYHADDYKAVATSAFRELRSSIITRDYIEKQTGLRLHVISNSEQRFLDYKSIACESDSFEKIIANGTAIVDIGGNSMQISVFDKDRLITTQNIRVGKISTREQYHEAAESSHHYDHIVTEVLEHELGGFGKLYQKDRPIQNLIIADADLLELVRSRYEDIMHRERPENTDVFEVSVETFRDLYQRMTQMSSDDISQYFDISSQAAQLVMQSMLFIHCLLGQMDASKLWLMDVSICDGMCYDYGLANKLVKQTHNFEDDIIAEAYHISKRYKSNQTHIRHMQALSTEIFNKMKKIHGMKNRERLLLAIAAILHNCGKYISLADVADCAYNIIMATEIIGLSHDERKIIANVVRYNTSDFGYYNEAGAPAELTRDEYLLVAKLTAILRLANALDRSHRQKCKDAVVTLKDDQLVISVATKEDLSLEQITLSERADFFEEVYNIHPVLKVRKL